MKVERQGTVVRGASRLLPVVLVLMAGVLGTGCRQDMHDQAKYQPLEASDLFHNGMASRPLPANTVAQGRLNEDVAYHTGKDEAGRFVTGFPLDRLGQAVEGELWLIPAPGALDAERKVIDQTAFTRAVVKRGQQRYEIFCVHCHGRTGSGNGMIVQRGFKQPESYHSDRLRASEVGYLVNVMTEGFGQMSSYAHMVPVEDRWAISSYIQVLQLSQGARDGDLSDEDVRQLTEGGDADEQGGNHGADAHSGAK